MNDVTDPTRPVRDVTSLFRQLPVMQRVFVVNEKYRRARNTVAMTTDVCCSELAYYLMDLNTVLF